MVFVQLLLLVAVLGSQPNCPSNRVEFSEAIGIIAGNSCKFLKIGGKTLSEEQASALSSVLSVNTVLVGLEMGNDRDADVKFSMHINTPFLGDDGMTALVPSLQQHPTLKVLRIGSNTMGNTGANAIADIIRRSEVLEELFVANNQLLGDEGTAILAAGLSESKNITSLELMGNKIGDAGAAAIAAYLQHDKHLRTLKLSHNEIGDAGAQVSESTSAHLCTFSLNPACFLYRCVLAFVQALGDALRVNTHLRRFKILDNRIGDTGITGLAESLKVNAHLQALDVTLNRFTSNGAKALGEALYHNRALQSLFSCKNRGVDEAGHQGRMIIEQCPE
jgi:Ran GTPase-activating protein (RanGAP) involved in mRNA processing and transport